MLNIKDEKQLEAAESNIAYIKLLDIDKLAENCVFNSEHIKTIHNYIFGDIYEWAGKFRTIFMVKGERVLGGDTVRYSSPDNIERDLDKTIAELNSINWAILSIDETAAIFANKISAVWQVHPFREGNTRTIITFATQFASAHGFRMDKQLLKDCSNYVRDALVKASDGQYSDYSYLTKIFKDAILNG